MAYPKEILDDLKAFIAATPDVEVAVVSQSSDDDQPLQEWRILNLAGDAKSFFRGIVEKAVIKPSARWNLRSLDILYKPEAQEVEYERVANIEQVEAAVEPLKNLSPLEAFSPSDAQFLEDLRYSALVLTGAGMEKAYFFRIFTSANELKRKPGTALVFRNGMYSKVEEQIFLFTEQIDCFVFKDVLFVVNKRNYRAIFDLLERIREEAEGAADKLQEVVPIENFAEFKAACGSQTTMADKLIEVSKRDYFPTLSVANLKPIIAEFDLNVEIGGGGESLVFDPRPAGRWHILRLVDDDYLRSSLTRHRYEVNSKTTL